MEMDADADLGERLYEACEQNDIEEAAGLIAQGADVNYANIGTLDTPLHIACEHDSPALARCWGYFGA